MAVRAALVIVLAAVASMIAAVAAAVRQIRLGVAVAVGMRMLVLSHCCATLVELALVYQRHASELEYVVPLLEGKLLPRDAGRRWVAWQRARRRGELQAAGILD